MASSDREAHPEYHPQDKRSLYPPYLPLGPPELTGATLLVQDLSLTELLYTSGFVLSLARDLCKILQEIIQKLLSSNTTATPDRELVQRQDF
ncbi:hypothetical protein DSO57_1013033 [Entomophthora muscae]|uniref:Uncharacterized protein n=1 Tax=Entomophthora muscae TaxID=34485 RepID=A0ACC2S849_9FUNG|nr:hypothetical protein DSO57_1013033 [Entomophthora muscae]